MFRFIPNVLLKQLYNRNSLHNTSDGFTFSLKNRLADARFTSLTRIRIDGKDYPVTAFRLELEGNAALDVSQISVANPLEFPLRRQVNAHAWAEPLAPGQHTLELTLQTQPFGTLVITVTDNLQQPLPANPHNGISTGIPRNPANDTLPDIIRQRQDYIQQFTQTTPTHLTNYGFDPAVVQGNCEQFVGVAQVPIGLAGPLRINGEHAQGDFLIPMATTEGTLVASYNRGIKLLNQCGG
jgi:hydroxymethylglutaryl-CoA reductase (NADPH)